MPDSPTTPPVILHPPPKGPTQGKGIQILPIKQILQRLLILIAQLKTENTSDTIVNKIRQTFHALYKAKETTKKCSIIYSTQYGDEYNTYQFRKQQDI